MIDDAVPMTPSWPAPPDGPLPAAHPARQVTKPTHNAKGGHRRHRRAPVKNTQHATHVAKHMLRGEP